MANPYVNKVELADGTLLIDISSDTVAADKMLDGYTAHGADGASVTGSIGNGTITNNTSGGTSSGTINRGNQIKIGAGYYPDDVYYQAQSNSGIKDISSAGLTNVDGYEKIYIATGSAYTPATQITSNPLITVSESGLITASYSKGILLTPVISSGYISSSSGQSGRVLASGSKTSQLPTQAGTTVTPQRYEQTVVTAGKYTTGAIVVAAIPDTYYTAEEALELFYPVGAIYTSTSSTAPTFGGIWQEIKITATWSQLKTGDRSYSTGTGSGTLHYWKRIA